TEPDACLTGLRRISVLMTAPDTCLTDLDTRLPVKQGTVRLRSLIYCFSRKSEFHFRSEESCLYSGHLLTRFSGDGIAWRKASLCFRDFFRQRMITPSPCFASFSASYFLLTVRRRHWAGLAVPASTR